MSFLGKICGAMFGVPVCSKAVKAAKSPIAKEIPFLLLGLPGQVIKKGFLA